MLAFAALVLPAAIASVKRGLKSTEAAAQQARERTTLSRVWLRKEDIPDSPGEAPREPDYDESKVPIIPWHRVVSLLLIAPVEISSV